jgi:hypothetical protein
MTLRFNRMIDSRFTAGENAGRTGTLHLAWLRPVPAG